MRDLIKNHQSPFTLRISFQGGFTLIELLVVIAIISILATLLFANFIGVRQRGRDAQRKSNLYNIQTAFELYRSDLGEYPSSIPACDQALSSGNTVYMQKFPCDPTSGLTYSYDPAEDKFTYTIIACLENSADSDKDTTPAEGCVTSFTLNNP